jgi:hypothetical protein
MADPTNPTMRIATDTYATLQQDASGAWTVVSFWCPSQAKPIPDAGAVRDQVVRLLPKIPIGIVAGHLSLVNVQEILWTPTAKTRELGTVSVVGQPVRVRITFAEADWDFGDGAATTTDQPGKVYHPDVPCATAQCPDYLGHTYRTTGPMTIRMTVHWNGQYSLDSGATWTAITGGDLPGQTSAAAIIVKQARAMLINPTN